jgi:hypothetical protein
MPGRAAALVRLDFAPQHQQPSAWRLLLATVASVVGSLAADAFLVTLTAWLPDVHILHWAPR